MSDAVRQPTVVVVGAGPAGLRAVEQLVKAGLRPVLIDEAARPGGQIYRQGAPALQRSLRERYGFEAGKAQALFETFDAVRPHVDYRPDTLVWHIENRALHLLHEGRGSVLPFDALLLCTGATERVLPFAGWTLPGVVSLGAAQIALKAHASLVGPRVVLAGSGPLLYLVAWQYRKAGAQVQAVLDTAPASPYWKALPGLLARPAMAAKGAWMLAALRAAGVPVHRGVSLLRAEGTQRVQRLVWSRRGREQVTECDALAFGHGLRSETQLADLAGCAFDFDAREQAWLVRADAAGATSVPGVHVAGDGARILGADAAELTGARAALSALQALGLAADAAGQQRVQQALAAHQRFRDALEQLASEPVGWAATVHDDVMVCRCEEVTAGELRACARETGALELNRLKAFSRVGMGRCQGRMCGVAAARLLAEVAGSDLAAVGRLRGQPPVKPVPVQVLADAGAALRAVPAGERDD